MKEGLPPRDESDILGNYKRWETDRDMTGPSENFRDERDRPLLMVARDIYRKRGKIAALDAGCGTGNALLDLREQIKITGGEDSKILTVGVNDQNFSNESMEREVREAVKAKKVKYVVGKIQDIKFANKFDLIWSYEVLLHNSNEEVAKTITNLLEALEDDGRMFLNMTEEQRSSAEISSLIENLESSASLRILEKARSRREERRIFMEFAKLPNDNP
jgi:SAM-dependent methyltransferase